MCSIFGWIGQVPKEIKTNILKTGSVRGRDGFGVWSEDGVIRNWKLTPTLIDIISEKKICLGNFRATPTTEAVSEIELLQPYDTFVHNGVIANDKEFGNFPIDSMALPVIFEDGRFDSVIKNVTKIKGSYALAYFQNPYSFILACNYKPIYFLKTEKGFAFASIPEMLPYSVPMDAYSAMQVKVDDYLNIHLDKVEIPRKQNNKVLVSASSGLDSTTVAWMLKDQGYEVTLVHFQYGCLAETKEVDRIFRIADAGGFDLKFIEMPKGVMTGTIVNGNYHKDGIEGAEYAEDWVSARNLLMLSLLTAYAETFDYGYIAFGGNLEESGSFADNEQEFGRRFNAILPYATQNGIKVELLQPLSNYMKHEIVKIGNRLGVPWELTWSCYSDGDIHCQNCGPCYMRRKAFERNGLKDPVFYDK